MKMIWLIFLALSFNLYSHPEGPKILKIERGSYPGRVLINTASAEFDIIFSKEVYNIKKSDLILTSGGNDNLNHQIISIKTRDHIKYTVAFDTYAIDNISYWLKVHDHDKSIVDSKGNPLTNPYFFDRSQFFRLDLTSPSISNLKRLGENEKGEIVFSFETRYVMYVSKYNFFIEDRNGSGRVIVKRVEFDDMKGSKVYVDATNFKGEFKLAFKDHGSVQDISGNPVSPSYLLER